MLSRALLRVVSQNCALSRNINGAKSQHILLCQSQKKKKSSYFLKVLGLRIQMSRLQNEH